MERVGSSMSCDDVDSPSTLPDVSDDAQLSDPNTPNTITSSRLSLRPAQRYVIEDTVGKGAYGTVYAARDTFAGTRVAVKCLKDASESTHDLRMSLREMRFLRLLRHANVRPCTHCRSLLGRT